jgi:hypothetical protein
VPFRREGLLVWFGRGAVFASNESDDNTYYFRGEKGLRRSVKALSLRPLMAPDWSRKMKAGQTLKLSPHEQLALALGLVNLKPPATILPE